MITDKAVEAGYAAMNYLAIGRDEVRTILEAAAPHMLAKAWDSCANQPSRPRLEDNPYRSAGVTPTEAALYPDGSLVEFDHHRPTSAD